MLRNACSRSGATRASGYQATGRTMRRARTISEPFATKVAFLNGANPFAERFSASLKDSRRASFLCWCLELCRANLETQSTYKAQILMIRAVEWSYRTACRVPACMHVYRIGKRRCKPLWHSARQQTLPGTNVFRLPDQLQT